MYLYKIGFFCIFIIKLNLNILKSILNKEKSCLIFVFVFIDIFRKLVYIC